MHKSELKKRKNLLFSCVLFRVIYFTLDFSQSLDLTILHTMIQHCKLLSFPTSTGTVATMTFPYVTKVLLAHLLLLKKISLKPS